MHRHLIGKLLGSSVLLAVLALGLIRPAMAAGTELCPIASDRLNRAVAYKRSDNVIRAPAGAAETAELMAVIKREAGEPRTIAIMRLGLAGNLEAFRLLYANSDIDGVYVYSSNYLNGDNTVCIDSKLERVLLERLNEPEMGRRLVALLGKNTYRNRGTLDALRQVPFGETPREAVQYVAFARAITSTNLPDIEVDVLAHAQSLLPFDSPIKKSELPGLHQHYVQFFVGRGYQPAVAYFLALLMQADRNEPVQSFQIKYGMLRTVVLRGLASFGSVEAHTAIVGELDAISKNPLDPFSINELDIISRLVIEMPRADQRNAVVTTYQRILGTTQLQRHDFAMRRAIYRSLGELNTDSSQALLIAEIRRYFSGDALANRNSALAKLFESLVLVQDLDIDPVLGLAEEAGSPIERRWIWGVVGAHPSEESVDFLLTELEFALTGGSQAEQILGANATAVLLKILVGMPSIATQIRVRDGLDALYDAGSLPVTEYTTASAKLNKALGNESPQYVAFQEQHARERAIEREVREQQALEEGIRKMRASYATELARNSSAEGVAQLIGALSAHGSGGRRAAQWLVIVGQPALPQLHEALLAVDTGDRQRFQIMSVLGEIGSSESIAPLIEAAENFGDTGFYRPAFFALALIPPSAESVTFAYAQLTHDVSERRQIAGLVYLAQIRHAPASDLVAQFTAGNLSPRLRSTGFYLGARLGVPGIETEIEAALVRATARSAERTDLETLLMGLAEVAPDTESFTRIASAAGFTEQSFRYREDLAYCAFRTATDAGKVELALQVLGSGSSQWQRREAIRYLITTDPQATVARLTGGVGQFLPLHQLLPMSSDVQLLFSEARRLGYSLEQTDEGYVLVSAEDRG